MRELVWTTLLVGILVPAAVSAEEDGGAPDAGTYTQAQPVQNPAHMGPPTGRSTDPNGNMGNEGRTGRASVPWDAAARDVAAVSDAPLVADGAVVPDGGSPDAPLASPKAPPESGGEGTSGGDTNKGGAEPDHTTAPSQGGSTFGEPKSE
ncbi:MAG TPA: hypothetical protein VHK47_22270 [Polyangia bacterium]|jgi:hypothetical protein|nr:hypothetical protein [Polyangia bacterium]